MYDESVGRWKDTVLVYFGILSLNLPAQIKESHEEVSVRMRLRARIRKGGLRG